MRAWTTSLLTFSGARLFSWVGVLVETSWTGWPNDNLNFPFSIWIWVRSRARLHRQTIKQALTARLIQANFGRLNHPSWLEKRCGDGLRNSKVKLWGIDSSGQPTFKAAFVLESRDNSCRQAWQVLRWSFNSLASD